MDEISNGSMNSPNKTLPMFFTHPISAFGFAAVIISAPRKDPMRTSMKMPEETTAAILMKTVLFGSVYLLRFKSIITERNKTMMAPA